jgi:hypothetical protein
LISLYVMSRGISNAGKRCGFAACTMLNRALKI